MHLGNVLEKAVTLLKSNFFAGLLVFIPFAVTAWMLAIILETLWQLHGFIPMDWLPESVLSDPILSNLINFLLTVVGAFVLAIGISFLGWASKNYFGKKVLEWLGELIQHIPVIRSVYSALDQLLKTVATGKGQQFSRVVYVEYPRKGMWSLAFVTGPTRGTGAPEKHLNIFIPTTPNPTSGFYLIVPESEVRESHMKVRGIQKPPFARNRTRKLK